MTQRDFTDKLVALLVEASNELNECIDLDYQADILKVVINYNAAEWGVIMKIVKEGG